MSNLVRYGIPRPKLIVRLRPSFVAKPATATAGLGVLSAATETDTATNLASVRTLPTATETDTATPLTTVQLPALIDGIEPETHVRMGVIQDSNGAYYRVSESLLADDNQPKMMKSTDGGLTWTEQDAANRPGTDTGSIGDLESGCVIWDPNDFILRFVWQRSFVAYSAFRTSDSSLSPDTWVDNTRENVQSATAGDPQYASITKPTDQSYEWIFWSSSTTQPQYRSRTGPGSYGTVTNVDTAGQHPNAVLGANTTDTWIVYEKSSQIHVKKLTSGGTLDSSSTRVDSSGVANVAGFDVPHCNPVAYTSGGNQIVSVMFADVNEDIKVVDIVNGTPGSEDLVTTNPPAFNVGDSVSQQGVMHLAVDGTTLHAIWADGTSFDVLHSQRPYGGSWSTPDTLYNTADGEEIVWVTNSIVTHDSVQWMAYTYDLGPHLDDDSNIWYDELELVVDNVGNLPTVTETDVATALTGTKTRTLTAATETDTAVALTGAKSRTLTAAIELDTATALTGAKSRTLPAATETDAAVALAGTKTRTLTAATETDVATALTGSKLRALPVAAETDVAVALTQGLPSALPAAVETDTAVPFTGAKTRSLTGAAELDVAGALTGAKSRALPAASEIDTAAPLTGAKLRALVAATETDLATALTGSKTATLPPALELDLALALMTPLMNARDITVEIGSLRIRNAVDIGPVRIGTVEIGEPRIGSVTIGEPRLGSIDVSELVIERGP